MPLHLFAYVRRVERQQHGHGTAFLNGDGHREGRPPCRALALGRQGLLHAVHFLEEVGGVGGEVRLVVLPGMKEGKKEGGEE